MAIDYQALKGRIFPEIVQDYGPRDCILYALGVGAGMERDDPADLPFTYEHGLKALPTLAMVLGYPGFWLREPGVGFDWRTVLATRQELVLHQPLPVAGRVIGRTAIEEVFDRGVKDGRGRGALMVTRRDVLEAGTGALLATVRVYELCRGEGGFGGPPPVTEPDVIMPERTPDAVITLASSPQAALIYRLTGDDNALHVDPQIARTVGFPGPILHGLATFGMAGRAVLRALCGDEPARLRSLAVRRFTAPVLPGQTLRFELWRTGAGEGRFRAFALDTDEMVLDGGHAAFDPD
ncbi:MaoC/PaaZ C-terminal domain-containing protein [Xanthobacteraceae bacterium A53D]